MPYNAVSGSDQVIINGVKSLPAVVATSVLWRNKRIGC